VDPREVYSKLVTADGQKKFIPGMQEDVVEFMNMLFTLLERGFEMNYKVVLI
jgi:hypothetical protein